MALQQQERRKEVCRRWNWDRKRICSENCPFQHICAICSNPHHQALEAHPTMYIPHRLKKAISTTLPTTKEEETRSYGAERTRGIGFYQQQKFEEALKSFQTAFGLIPGGRGSESNFIMEAQKICIDIGMCHISLKQPEHALRWFDRVINSSNSSQNSQTPYQRVKVKALFQRGRAFRLLGRNSQAENDLSNAKKMAFPAEDQAIEKELKLVQSQLLVAEKDLCLRMFNQAQSSSETNNDPISIDFFP